MREKPAQIAWRVFHVQEIVNNWIGVCTCLHQPQDVGICVESTCPSPESPCLGHRMAGLRDEQRQGDAPQGGDQEIACGG
jgi:hypothetical protein